MAAPALHITTRSGSVRVTAAAGAALTVTGATIEPRDDGGLQLRREQGSGTIEVRCAPGTDVTVGTVSGRVECTGDLGAVRVATASGAIRVESAARADVRSKSGSVEIGACAAECRVMTKSSKVRVGRAGTATVAAVSGAVSLLQVGGAEVKTVSARILLALAPDARRVTVRSVSGRVEIVVPPAMRPSTRLRSVSGRVECDVAPGHDAELSVASVSGLIRIAPA